MAALCGLYGVADDRTATSSQMRRLQECIRVRAMHGICYTVSQEGTTLGAISVFIIRNAVFNGSCATSRQFKS